MLNYFSDNQDLEFTLHNLELAEITAMLEKNYENAEKFAKRLLSKSPDNASALLCLGNIAYCRSHYETALTYLIKSKYVFAILMTAM